MMMPCSHRFRLGVFALAKELGNVRAACRMMGIHHSTFYRWRKQMERHGLEILRSPLLITEIPHLLRLIPVVG